MVLNHCYGEDTMRHPILTAALAGTVALTMVGCSTNKDDQSASGDKSDKPVIVDFWAEWCGPCRQIGPALEQIADELGGQVTVAKINIDDTALVLGLGLQRFPSIDIISEDLFNAIPASRPITSESSHAPISTVPITNDANAACTPPPLP